MASPVQHRLEGAPSEPGLSTLVKGIVDDVGDLIKQQIDFARTEVTADLRKTKEAAGALAIGAGVTTLGGLFLGFMLVHLLHWLTAPAGGADPSSLPLWSCYAIVGALLLGCGAALILAGKKKLSSFNPLPDETVKTMKENVQWITSSK
jgi:hypothetical protein